MSDSSYYKIDLKRERVTLISDGHSEDSRYMKFINGREWNKKR